MGLPCEPQVVPMNTLTEILEQWTEKQPDRPLFTFLDAQGRETEAYTYGTFLQRTAELAAWLSGRYGLRSGDRVLLVYPPGLELIVAFYACVRLGVISVPTCPPTPMNFEAGLSKLRYVAENCEARAALTTRGLHNSYRLLLAQHRASSPGKERPGLSELQWGTTDDAQGIGGHAPHTPCSTAFIQYTSGATSHPKGVIVSHRNVIENGRAVLADHVPVGVSWLPQHHDMGFIGYYLYTIVSGGCTYGFSPLDFLKRPALWLQTITRVGATIASGPNFAYDYCLRPDKLPDEELEGTDLSAMRVLMNAAETVRAETFHRFHERFARYGLRTESYMAGYGLAENTLAATMFGKRALTVNKHLLQQGKLHVERAAATLNNNHIRIMSCGKPLAGVAVKIVEPNTRRALPEDQIGEIWLAGPSKAVGYWNRPELTRETFEATIENDDAPGRTYLRTGDLGFVREGELYVTGRVKDLIIVRGVNYYPQDIEAIVETACAEIRPGCAAAFSVEMDGEALVVVAEVKDEKVPPDPLPIVHALRTQYYVEPSEIVFVKRRGVAKTTSGKVARSRMREAWLKGELPVVTTHRRAREARPEGAAACTESPMRERFRYLVELYNITGREQCTFAEIGLDSLTMVNLIGDIKELLVEHGAGDLIDEVDVRLLQKLSIAQFFGLLDHFENGRQEPLQGLAKLLRIMHEEYDARERECMQIDAQFALPCDAEKRPSSEPVSSVLFTGATGFFGPFLLASLLRSTRHTFRVLIRATDPAHGADRIRAAMRRAGLLTPAVEDAIGGRVEVICGDLGRDRLGLTARQWDGLADGVQAICHNAALVNYMLSYEALRPHNVDGTRTLLRLAFSGRRKAFHLISSTFIFGWSLERMLWETDSNPGMAGLDFGYAQTKWVAEQLAWSAARQGLDVRVYRPSLISPSTTAVGSKDDIAIRLIAFMVR